MKILVTGGSGFIGTWLIRRLLNKWKDIVNFDLINFPERSSGINGIRGDVRDYKQVKTASRGMDIIFHLAALPAITRAGKKIIEVNVRGTENVLRAGIENKIKKVIYVSSSAVFGIPKKLPINKFTPINPIDIYGKSKAEAEMVCQNYRNKGLNVIIMRPCPVIGPERLGVFGILFDWIYNNRNIFIIGSGLNKLEFVHVSDFCNACILALERANNVTFEIGGGGFSTLKEDLASLIKHAQKSSKIISLNKMFARITLFILDFIRLSPLTRFHYLTYSEDFYCDDYAQEALGYYPSYDNKKALAESYDWYVSNLDKVKNILSSAQKNFNQMALRMLKYPMFTNRKYL